ncbi:MAG: hypothetical protein R3305_07415, partial [Gammaproteobacteria bacterium]|nr:hypothetical protein [Gammaproteobacteria bacterium]
MTTQRNDDSTYAKFLLTVALTGLSLPAAAQPGDDAPGDNADDENVIEEIIVYGEPGETASATKLNLTLM